MSFDMRTVTTRFLICPKSHGMHDHHILSGPNDWSSRGRRPWHMRSWQSQRYLINQTTFLWGVSPACTLKENIWFFNKNKQIQEKLLYCSGSNQEITILKTDSSSNMIKRTWPFNCGEGRRPYKIEIQSIIHLPPFFPPYKVIYSTIPSLYLQVARWLSIRRTYRKNI